LVYPINRYECVKVLNILRICKISSSIPFLVTSLNQYSCCLGVLSIIFKRICEVAIDESVRLDCLQFGVHHIAISLLVSYIKHPSICLSILQSMHLIFRPIRLNITVPIPTSINTDIYEVLVKYQHDELVTLYALKTIINLSWKNNHATFYREKHFINVIIQIINKNYLLYHEQRYSLNNCSNNAVNHLELLSTTITPVMSSSIRHEVIVSGIIFIRNIICTALIGTQDLQVHTRNTCYQLKHLCH
jgi:hypothetical protein